MDELLSESALMNVVGGSPGVIEWTIGVLVAVAVFSKVAVGWLMFAAVTAGGSVAVLLAALAGGLLDVTPGAAEVKLHASMAVNNNATLNQVVNLWKL